MAIAPFRSRTEASRSRSCSADAFSRPVRRGCFCASQFVHSIRQAVPAKCLAPVVVFSQGNTSSQPCFAPIAEKKSNRTTTSVLPAGIPARKRKRWNRRRNQQKPRRPRVLLPGEHPSLRSPEVPRRREAHILTLLQRFRMGRPRFRPDRRQRGKRRYRVAVSRPSSGDPFS